MAEKKGRCLSTSPLFIYSTGVQFVPLLTIYINYRYLLQAMPPHPPLAAGNQKPWLAKSRNGSHALHRSRIGLVILSICSHHSSRGTNCTPPDIQLRVTAAHLHRFLLPKGHKKREPLGFAAWLVQERLPRHSPFHLSS